VKATETTNANKMKGDAPQQEGEELAAELQRPSTVTTGLEVFDSPACFEPLGPPIFQVHARHIRTKLL
jgi:hypothetical protein